jgi:hypothetical protein
VVVRGLAGPGGEIDGMGEGHLQKAGYGANATDIKGGVELTGVVYSSDQWGEVEVVVGGLVGLGGEIEQQGRISPKS